MRRSGNQLNQREARFVTVMAATGNAVYSAGQAGYAEPNSAATRLMQREPVLAEIGRQTKEEIAGMKELAVGKLRYLLTAKGVSDRTVLDATKYVLDRTMGFVDGADSKDISSMSAGELQAAVDVANRRIAELNGTIVDVEHETIVASPFD